MTDASVRSGISRRMQASSPGASSTAAISASLTPSTAGSRSPAAPPAPAPAPPAAADDMSTLSGAVDRPAR